MSFGFGEWQYLGLLQNLIVEGNYREGRNGNTYSLFGAQMRFDLRQGFPLLTTKKINFKAIITELIWFIRGDTNIKYLNDRGVHIWDQWADENGDLGPVYGKQWRSWPHNEVITYDGGERFEQQQPIDQLKNVIDGIKRDPYGRRHIVTAWNPAEIDKMALPPCHTMFQFHVGNGKLNCQLYQRSGDWFLGVPFNIASYALLTHLVARECGLVAGDFIHTLGDYHLYANHFDAAKEQLKRTPVDFPNLLINAEGKDIFQIDPEDIEIYNYYPASPIKAEVSV